MKTSAKKASRAFLLHNLFGTKRDSCTSRGNALYSYTTAIAAWKGPILIVNESKYSATTSRHQHALRLELSYSAPELVIKVNDIRMGSDRHDLINAALEAVDKMDSSAYDVDTIKYDLMNG
jgi:hypothetical protein